MGDDEGCSAFGELLQRLLDVLFGFGVQGRGGFVEEDDPRIFQDCTGDGNALFLASGETETAFADFGAVLVGEGHDFVVDPSSAACFVHHFVGGICVGVFQIIPGLPCQLINCVDIENGYTNIIVSLNNTVSCGTTPIFSLTLSIVISRTSWPSMDMEPSLML